jgi:dTMP kinase
VRAFDGIGCRGTQPDLTVLLDLDPGAAMARAGGRAALRRSRLERFEALGIGFQRRVRVGYRAIARQDPRRVKLVRADRSVAEIQDEIGRLVETLLARRGERKQAVHPKT